MFCPNCGTLMRPKKVEKELVYICPSCGYEMKRNPKSSAAVVTKVAADNSDVVITDSQKKLALPIVDAECPKCGNGKAYLEIVQTRAADEPPTRIYTCTECGYTWREYS